MQQAQSTVELNSIDLVAMDGRHLDEAVTLSREAGWPHRRDDWAMSLALGQGFVALQGDRVIGTIMMTPFGEAAATISLVIVSEAARGRGLGRRLMNVALEAAGSRECRLVATADGLPLYEKLGFEKTHEIRQHQGIVTAGLRAPMQEIALAGAEDIAAIQSLDRLARGFDREQLLRQLNKAGRFAVLRKDGRIIGYAAVRAFGRGDVVGPVVAETREHARALLDFFLKSRAGSFVRVDTPLALGLSPWLVECGLAEVGGGIGMRRGDAALEPAGPLKPFALFSQALG